MVEVDLTGSTFLLVVVVVLVQSSQGSAVVLVLFTGSTGLVVVVELVQSSHGASVVAGSTGLVVVVVVDSQAKAEEARRVVARTAEVDLTIMIGKRVTWLVLKE